MRVSSSTAEAQRKAWAIGANRRGEPVSWECRGEDKAVEDLEREDELGCDVAEKRLRAVQWAREMIFAAMLWADE